MHTRSLARLEIDSDFCCQSTIFRGTIEKFQRRDNRAREQSYTERFLGQATRSSQPRDRTRGRKQSVEDDWPNLYLAIQMCQSDRDGPLARVYRRHLRIFMVLCLHGLLELENINRTEGSFMEGTSRLTWIESLVAVKAKNRLKRQFFKSSDASV